MPAYPSGTVAFLFTDIEGSTRRWEHDSTAMGAAVDRHIALLDDAITQHEGVHFKTIGDAVQAAFPTVRQAVAAAYGAQVALLLEDWGAVEPLRVRMAIHVGTAHPRDGDYAVHLHLQGGWTTGGHRCDDAGRLSSAVAPRNEGAGVR